MYNLAASFGVERACVAFLHASHYGNPFSFGLYYGAHQRQWFERLADLCMKLHGHIVVDLDWDIVLR